MDLHRVFQEAHEEHADILEFLAVLEGALQVVASDDRDKRCKGLHQLQAMQSKIVEIWEHCHKEEDSPEEPLFRFASPVDRERLKDEHFQLYRDNYELRREMEFATPDSTANLVLKGQKLLAELRAHIAFEEELLKRLEHEQAELTLAAAQ